MSDIYDYYNRMPRARLIQLTMTYHRNQTAYDDFVTTHSLEGDFDDYFDEWMVDNGHRFAVPAQVQESKIE